ncbi:MULTISPECIES: DUF2848 domain-containing protein [Prauserella salsuginis group]|uniref:DUF2848 domain-containing protein n=1 Tax=Prauserella salsuginis TaxID=387889 RepID=A0ABW6FVX0_9PSEU|nr:MULTISPECIES: DUF2848 domain-containing protein [Prauserella salsuginis group]MCR3720125.1 Protein of unknown function (DUF2848) [Prauserella flava]MCR3734166.1 Protein of unknown function (DUF2848) [Prauserella salsuginis]
MARTATSLRLRTVDGQPVDVTPGRLVVAGYTGRNQDAVRHHIEELAAIGVPEPDSIPAFYELDTGLLTVDETVEVGGRQTSGEVEPVLVRTDGRYYLTVGSDHTDRALERHDIKASKGACPKPVAGTVIDLGTQPESLPWDEITAACWLDGELYQDGTLAQLLPITQVLAEWDSFGSGDVPLVLFGGTMPLLDGEFRFGREWRMRLHVPGQPAVEFTYTTSVREN